jgi:hypothetical protein
MAQQALVLHVMFSAPWLTRLYAQSLIGGDDV